MNPDNDGKYWFKIPQKALIKKNGKFLILKRGLETKHYPGHWDFPGGKLEHGEGPKEGLVREVKEETSLDVKVLSPIFSYLETKNTFAYIVVYNCKLVGGKIKLSFEHTDYKWVSGKELLSLVAEPYLKALIKELKD